MSDLVVVMRSGKEFHFSCENYEIEFSNINGSLLRFSYEGGIGECPVYIPVNDIEAIAVITNSHGFCEGGERREE